jgi:hypothetical protein
MVVAGKAAMVLLLGALAGCGSTSAGPSRAQREGTAAGRALVCVFSQARIVTPQFLAMDFDGWVTGNAAPDANQGLAQPCPPPPRRALSPGARGAAAAVVLSWARSQSDRLGPRAIGYLKSHGI